MTTMMTVREKADEFKAFLSEPNRLKNIQDVLPAKADAHRMLSVVFATAIKNPKILDCTKPSILNAVMSIAELNIEPILGRAYLIPYNNSKKINGKWVKVLECQFQIGWQGLIDLARRSGTIADVYGYNVYENDEFDITFGLNQNLHHRPWYMFPDKVDQGPGEIIGAYCVWVLKDGTKHPEFMPISEIHKRRDVSQSYQSAVKYDKTDSPWMKWPEEMNLKTVIKHSSKMVPASIEFLKASQYDDAVEVGEARSSYSQFFSGEDAIPVFDKDKALLEVCRDNDIGKERLDDFIDAIAEKYDSNSDEITDNIIEDPEGFLEQYKIWEDATFEKSLADEIGKLKTTGLLAWERENHAKIGDLSDGDKTFFLDKWERVVGTGYYKEGQPGYKPEPSNDGTSSQLKSEFYRAMMEYQNGDTGIGKDKFYAVLGSSGYEDIADIPESEFTGVLQSMEDAR